MGIENWFHKKKEDATKAAVKVAAAATLAAGVAADAGAAPKTVEKDGHTIEAQATQQTVTNEHTANFYDGIDTTTHGLEPYTASKTKEGGITPTGKSNSFLENTDHLTVDSLYKIAEAFGFRTGSNKEFQEDMVNYLLEHDPKVIDEILGAYAQTNHAKDIDATGLTPKEIAIKSLIDNNLGVRTKKLADYFLGKIPETVVEKKKTDPYERWGGHREPIYGPNHHIVAELWYPTTETHDVRDAGNLNTQTVKPLFRERNDFGYTGREFEIDASKVQAYTGSTNTFQSDEAMKRFEQEATQVQGGETAHYYDGFNKINQ